MVVAVVEDTEQLRAAMTHGIPVWVVHRKGRGVAFGEDRIRRTLRAEGWRDTKSCSVSDRLSATRYLR